METYLIVRLHGLIQHLLRKEDYEWLLKGRSLRDLPEYSHIENEDSLEEVLNKIDNVLMKRLNFLADLQSKFSPFITAFSDRLEIENIKVRLRQFHGRQDKKSIYTQYAHFTSPDELMEIDNEEKLWTLLQNTPYHTVAPTEEILKDSLEFKEAYLDSCYYAYIRSVIPKKERKELGELLDLEGLITSIYWMLVFNEDKMIKLIEERLHGFKPSFIKVKEFNLKNVYSLLKVDWNLADKLVKQGEISKLMRKLKKAHLELVREKAERKSLSSLFLYYYLLLIKYERDNLHKMVLGRVIGLKREKIKQTLLFLF